MKVTKLQSHFLKYFDVVGIIHKNTYLEGLNKLGIKGDMPPYETMVVVGLHYPKRVLKPDKNQSVASFYTFGKDYHDVLKERMRDALKGIDNAYELAVDNHPFNERLAAMLAGVGYFGKNQLIINKDFGSYLFLGIVFIDLKLESEIILDLPEDCGTCTKCIDACPTHALSEDGYQMEKCISYFNQEKTTVPDDYIAKNYQLLGCDICQMVCPKNIHKKTHTIEAFELSGKELVDIDDLFKLSNKAFQKKYQGMAYLWKGKTLLMRNQLWLFQRKHDASKIDLIKNSIDEQKPKWYVDTAHQVLNHLNHHKGSDVYVKK